MMVGFRKFFEKRSALQLFMVQLTGSAMTMLGTAAVLNLFTGSSFQRDPFNICMIFLFVGPGLLALNEPIRIWTVRLAWFSFILGPLVTAASALIISDRVEIPLIGHVPYWTLAAVFAVLVMGWSILMIRVLTLPATCRRFRKKARPWSSWATALIFLTIPLWFSVWYSNRMTDAYLRNIKAYDVEVILYDKESGKPLLSNTAHGMMSAASVPLWTRPLANEAGSSAGSEGIKYRFFYIGINPLIVPFHAVGYADTTVALPRSGTIRIPMERQR